MNKILNIDGFQKIPAIPDIGVFKFLLSFEYFIKFLSSIKINKESADLNTFLIDYSTA